MNISTYFLNTIIFIQLSKNQYKIIIIIIIYENYLRSRSGDTFQWIIRSY